MASKQKRASSKLSTTLERPCNLFFLRRAARAVTKQYTAHMKASGIQPTQFTVLHTLSESGPLSISSLANQMGLDRTSMSRTVTPLQKEGLITVSAEGWRRTREVAITPEGEQVLQQTIPLWNEAQAFFLQQMGEEDTDSLTRLLEKVSEKIVLPE